MMTVRCNITASKLLTCFTSPKFVVQENKGHYEKWKLIPQCLKEYEQLSGKPKFLFNSPNKASEEQLSMVHDPNYVHSFMNGTLDGSLLRKIGFQWSQDLVESTLYFNGATIDATMKALELSRDHTLHHQSEGGLISSCSLAGGSHHAHYDYGSGYCVFNDQILGAETARLKGLIQNYLIIDLDVHQGDGSASMCNRLNANNGTQFDHAFTFSMHAANNFPLRKQQSSFDVVMPNGTRDMEYLTALGKSFRELPDKFHERTGCERPDIILYQSGVDVLENDHLGKLCMSIEGLEQRDRMVYEYCKSLNSPLVVTLGGGYPSPNKSSKYHPMDTVVRAHGQTIQLLHEYL